METFAIHVPGQLEKAGEPPARPGVWRSLARNPCVGRRAISALLALGGFACAGAPPSPPPPPRPAVAPPATIAPPTTACSGDDLDLRVALDRCVCSTKAAPTEHACTGESDNGSPQLIVTARPSQPSVVAGAALPIDLVLENHGTAPLRIDLPPAFRPELVVFSPQGVRIEPPNGTTQCPLADTVRFVAGKVRIELAPGGTAHARLPWSARAVDWDETRHAESGRCEMSRRGPLAKGTYEIKIIADLLGISSDDPAKNPRCTVDVHG